MAVYEKSRRAYSINSPFADIFSPPVVANRAPTVNDNLEIGRVWIDKSANDVYFMVNRVANQSVFINAGGGSGSFNSLTVTTTATIGTDLTVTAGDFEVTAGDVTIGAFAAAGVVINDATGVLATSAGTNGQVIIGSTGAAPAWATLTAGGGITITEGPGTLTISNPGATGTTFTTSDANVVAPDGAGNTDILGYDANITTDGATANTVKIRLADDIVSVASITATNDFTMLGGTFTVTSDDNAADAIYLHTNGGVNEQIHIHVDQGTAINSITVESDVGGLVFASGLASADAINITASNAAGGIDVDAGTAGINVAAANGPLVFTSGTGNISFGADATDHDIEIGDAAGTNALALISGTGHTAMTSTGNITLDAAGVVEFNSSGGIISIGNDNVAQNVNLGTNGVRTISIGNSNGATAVDIDCGTGNLTLGTNATAHVSTLGSTNTTSSTVIQAGTGATTITAGGIFDLNATDAVTIDSTAGAISVGAGIDNFAVNISTGGTRLTTIGNGTATSSVAILSGTSGIDIGVNAIAKTCRLGSTTGASALTLQSGTGDFIQTAGGILDINATGDTTIDVSAGILDISTSGNITVDSSAGTIGIGVDDIDQAINIATNGERLVTVGNQVGAAGIVIASGTTGTAINASGLLSTEAVGVSDASAGVTINTNVGYGTFTGLTTAAGASQDFTVTNALCTTTSAILCTMANFGANDAQMTITRVVPAAGSFVVSCTNNGAADLNGNCVLTFWIMDAAVA